VTDTTSEKKLTSSSSGGDSTSESALVTQHGRTTITDAVVSKIAGISTRDVSGVYALGGGAARAVGAIRERIPGSRTNHSQGVSVEVGERQAAIDVQIVAEYGVAIADLAEGVRRNVIASLERMTGLEVTEVNVTVQDVHLESDDSSEESEDDQQPARVQ
jgi:uncharacterized alkaline shock family protein YloU